MLKTKLFYLAIVLIVFIILFFIWQMTAYKSSEPKFRVINKANDIQIRVYPRLIVAQTQVDGERYSAINDGFRILADYIFGNNVTEKKITMTSPVIQQGVKIAMTAPVLQQQNGNMWIVRFIMPTGFTLTTLPKPNNKKITLLEIPERKYAVIQFSGSNSDENLHNHLTRLMDYITKNQINKIGEPVYAFYNPPWILPFLRRNEIMIEIE